MPINPSIPLGVEQAPLIQTPEQRLSSQTAQLELGERQRAIRDQQQLRGILTKYNGDFERALPEVRALNPTLALKIEDTINESHAHALEYQARQLAHQKAQVDFYGQLAGSVTDQASLDAMRYTADKAGLDVSQVPQTWDPATSPPLFKAMQDATLTAQQRIAQHEKQLADERAEREATRKEAADAAKARSEEAKEAAAIARQTGLDADRKIDNDRQAARDVATAARDTRRLGIEQQNANANMIRANRPAAAAADSTNVPEAVAGMKEGTIPPQLPGRASKDYTAIMAEARRQHFDLAGAATDWAATQKHIATLNNAQQTRLNQSINQLPELLDSIDVLADKWKAGRFPLLNRANLALAKGGAFGKDAASVANQLDAQIADVTADLGNVYMGGNSPTDHALGLAAKSLSSDWDARVLHDMTALARQNVKIRQNSIRNTGVQGASEGNPYAPKPTPAPTAAPARVYYDSNGKPIQK